MNSGRTLAPPPSKGPSSGPPSSGTRLEPLQRYTLVVRLGYGAMAEVFLATRELGPLMHEPVIVRRLHKHFAESPKFVRAFVAEATLARGFEHPHIVKTLELGLIDGQCCVAREYQEGQPLGVVLRRAYDGEGMPLDLAVYIVICMLEGLHYAHEVKDGSGRRLEVVHRGVSPENVFVTNEGGVKVLDFSNARTPGDGKPSATHLGRGKPAYIAPEEDAESPVDRRADVWSVGVVLWEALTGKRLFKGETDGAPFDKASKRRIPAAGSVQRDVPAALDAIVARALAWNPGERYQTALEMQGALERWLTTAGKSKDPVALAAFMLRIFANEAVEQRRLVSVLRGGGDDPMRSSRSASDGASGPPHPGRSASGAPPHDRPSRTMPGAPSSTRAFVVDPPALGTDDAPASDSSGDDGVSSAPAFRYRWLVAIFFTCAGLSAIVTFLMSSKILAPATAQRSSPAAIREQPLPPAPAGPAPEEEPIFAPGVPSVETLAELPAPADEALRAAAPTTPAPLARALHVAVPARAAIRQPTPSEASVEAPSPSPGTPAAPPSLKAAVPEDAPGFLTVDTTPWSIVSENGTPLGQTPLVHLKLASGVHVLSLKNPELGVETRYTVTIEAGKTLVKRIGIE